MAIITTVRTTKGEEISAHSLANNLPVTFTSFQIGSGTTPGVLKDRTALISSWKTYPVSSVELMTDGKVRVRGALDNSGIANSISFREIGLFAECGAVSGLYAYGHCNNGVVNYPDTIPDIATAGYIRRLTDIVVDVANAPDVTFTVSEETAAPEDFDELVSEIGDTSTVIDIPDGIAYPKTLAGIIKQIYDSVLAVVGRFTSAILKIENGGTGASTAAGARAALGVTLANLGAASTSHIHANATQSANGFMVSTDKAKIDEIINAETFSFPVTAAAFPVRSSAGTCACADSVNVYRAMDSWLLSQSGYLDIYNKSTGAVESILTDFKATALCVFGGYVYGVSANVSKLFKYNVSSKTFALIDLQAAVRPAICTDGVNVYMPRYNSAIMDVYNIATGVTNYVALPASGIHESCCTDGVNVYTPRNNYAVLTDVYNISSNTVSSSIASPGGESGSGAGIEVDAQNIYMIRGGVLYVCNKSTKVFSTFAAPRSPEAKKIVQTDGFIAYVGTNSGTTCLNFFNKATGEVSFTNALYSADVLASDGANVFTPSYAAGKIQTFRESLSTKLSALGVKIITFDLLGSGTVSFNGAFTDSCFFASAVRATGAEAPLTALSKTGATFTVTAGVYYTGVAVGI